MNFTPDYEKDKAPNENDLFGDWLRQSFLYDYYATEYKEACNNLLDKKYDSMIAKEKLEHVKAKKDLDIRKNPEKYELGKLTEKTIESTITIDKEVLESQDDLNKIKKVEIEVQKNVNLLQVAERVIGEQKKKSLEELTKAFYCGFFADPKLDEMDEEIFEDNARKKLNTRRKSV